MIPLLLRGLVLGAVLTAAPAAATPPPPVVGAQRPLDSPPTGTLLPDIPPPTGPSDAEIEDGQAYVLDPISGKDPDVADMSIVSATPPLHGTLRIDRGRRLIYRPRPGYRGLERFSYTLAAADGSRLLSSLTLRVIAAPPGPRSGEIEMIPWRFSASSAYSDYTGLTSSRGMRDGVYDQADSIHGTQAGANEWILADLGAAKQVSRIVIACAAATAPGAWGCNNTNGARLEVSADGTRWRSLGRVTDATEDAPASFDADGAAIRLIRLSRSGAYLGVGDFRVFGPEPPPAD